MREPKTGADIRLPIQRWELDLIRAVVKESGEREADELEAELAQTLANLKFRIPPGIRNWKAYLREALRNKARNWFRNRRRRLRREVTIVAAGDETPQGAWISEESLPTREAHDLRIALAELWEKLDPGLRESMDAPRGRGWQSDGGGRAAGIAPEHGSAANLPGFAPLLIATAFRRRFRNPA